ncbi:MAG TPA: hypothetical protein VFT29_11250 [Gemmatimonadaceae bacterium]|nr:hypothetical protein [Gemmatimonadaceae bacterium]
MLSRIGFSPAFSQAATEIFRNLEAFGYEVNNVHVVLTHANGHAAKDTVVIVAPGQDSVAIQMAVNLDGLQEELSAAIELRDDNTTLFSGTQKISAKVGSTPPAPPPIPVEFTGPGATAKTLTLAPQDTTVIVGDSLTFRPTAKDNNGQNVANLALAWSVKDGQLGTVNGNGVFRAFSGAGRGSTYVIARLLSGPKDSAHVVLSLPASKVVLVSGGNQTGVVGQPLSQPIVFQVQASDDVPVPSVAVVFDVQAGGGSVSPILATSDANGLVSTTFTLGTTAGANQMRVRNQVVPFALLVPATGIPEKAAKLAVTQQPSSTVASGAVLGTQPKVQLQDTYGNEVSTAGVAVVASLSDGRTLGGTLTALTDASGLATFTDLSISGTPGSTAITFSQQGLTSAVSNAVTVTVGAPAAMTLEGSSQLTVVAGQSIPASSAILVADGSGNGVPNVDVAVQVLEGGEILRFDQTLKTDATGRVPLSSIPLGTKAGLFVINASNAALQGAGSPVAAAVTITHASASKLAFLQQPSNTASGAIISPAVMVQVQDDFNNLVTTGPGSTTTVDLSLSGGTPGAVLGPNPAALSQAAVSGIATFNVSVDKVGTGYVLSASKTGLTTASSTTFEINTGGLATISAAVGDNTGAAKGQEILLKALVKDASGNPVPVAAVTFTVASGGGDLNSSGTVFNTTTDASGLAQVDWRVGLTGVQLVTATAAGGALSVDFHAFIFEKITITQEPTATPQSAVLFPTQPKLQLRDLQGNVVALAGQVVNVTVVKDPPLQDVATSLSGTFNVASDAAGVVSWTDLGITGNPVPQTLRLVFTPADQNVPPVQSQLLALQAGTNLQFGPDFNGADRRFDPATTGTVGVRVTDGQNNPVPNVPVLFGVVSGSCGFPGANTASTDASGIATVSIGVPAAIVTCVIHAQNNTGNPPPEQQTQVRIYGAPADFIVWRGADQTDPNNWNNKNNWVGGLQPSQGSSVLVPALAPNMPKLTTITDIDSLYLEAGASLDLNAQPLNLRGSLSALGPLNNGSVVTLTAGANSTGAEFIRGNVNAAVMILEDGASCGSGPGFVAVADVTVNSLEVHCTLVVLPNVNLTVSNSLLLTGTGAVLGLAGTGSKTLVKGDAQVKDGQLAILDLAELTVDGSLSVTQAGSISQGGGTILVKQDATFAGGQSVLSGGVLEVQGNFAHAGNGDNLTFFATNGHVTRLSGSAGAAPLKIQWDLPQGSEASQFSILEITTKSPGREFLSTAGNVTARIENLLVRPDAWLRVDANLLLKTGGIPGEGVTVDRSTGAAVLFNNGSITVEPPTVGTPPSSCPVPQGAIDFALSCVTGDQFSGQWIGTGSPIGAMSANLTQSRTSVSGQVTLGNCTYTIASGIVTGGSLSISTSPSTSAGCVGFTLSFGGSVDINVWSGSGVQLDAAGSPTNFTFNMTKQ